MFKSYTKFNLSNAKRIEDGIMNKEVLSYEDVIQDYVVYFYANNGLGQMSRLTKKCFKSKEDIVRFIKEGKYTEIDNIYIKGKRVNYKIETVVELGDGM